MNYSDMYSHKHNVEQKKSNTKEYVQYEYV